MAPTTARDQQATDQMQSVPVTAPAPRESFVRLVRRLQPPTVGLLGPPVCRLRSVDSTQTVSSLLWMRCSSNRHCDDLGVPVERANILSNTNILSNK
jgi:hypothetical protein